VPHWVESGRSGVTGKVVLGHVLPFQLGALLVQPSLLRLSRDGIEEFMQPRAMQVLVALFLAADKVLTRDDLMETCWGGTIVTDDALSRIVSQLRKLTDGIGHGAFAIETVNRVGYRMLPHKPSETLPYLGAAEAPRLSCPPPPGEEVVHTPPQAVAATLAFPGRPGIRSYLPGLALVEAVRHSLGVGLVLATLAGVAFFLRSPIGTSPPPLLAVVAQPNSSSEALARQIESDLMRLTRAHGGFLTVTPKPEDADYVLRVEHVLLAAGEALDLRLATNRPTHLLWSTSFQYRRSADVRGEASAKLAEVLLCAMKGAGRMSWEALSIYMAACETIVDRIGAGETGADEQLISLLEQVTRKAPDFSWAWGELAVAEANRYLYFRNSVGPEAAETQAALNRARDRIARARELEPQLAPAFLAESALLTFGTYKQRLELLERGIEKNPAEPTLYAEYSRILFEVGRLTDAIHAAQQATSLHPLSLKARATLVDSLAHAGSVVRARRELAAAKQLWPHSQLLRTTLFSIELRYGDPRLAQQMLDRGEAALAGPTGGFGAPESLMRARLDPSPQNIRKMVQLSSGQMRPVPQPVSHHVQALGHAEAVEDFYNFVGQPKVAALLPSEVLFRPHLKPFRDDIRFMRLAWRLGLVEYWISSNRWPDFCKDPGLPYECGDEAARILQSR
jgi:DNA-binding winged helix-turn-helix (wHTH) protein/tetratricopeptide (TPR) repeat protein